MLVFHSLLMSLVDRSIHESRFVNFCNDHNLLFSLPSYLISKMSALLHFCCLNSDRKLKTILVFHAACLCQIDVDMSHKKYKETLC